MKTRLFISVFVILLLCGCNKKYQIGILFPEQNHERWQTDKEMLIRNISEKGGEPVFYESNNDAHLQYQQAEKLINNGINALILVPVDLYQAAEIVKLAHENNVKVISYDRLIKNADIDFYISFDNVEVGRLQAEYLTKVCPNGNYAIIGGATSDNNSFLLRIGQMNVLQPLVVKGDINIVYDKFVDMWSEDEAYKLMTECLQKFDVNAVVAANDRLASGVIRALDDFGYHSNVFISGQDATVQACKNIIKGRQSMTVYKPIEAIADKASDIALKFARGGVVEDAQITVYNGKKLISTILLAPIVVNKETMDLTVIADGYVNLNDLK